MKEEKSYQLNRVIIAFTFTMIVLSCKEKINEKWPQFRGSESNMIAHGSNLPVEWGNNKNISWTYQLSGSGWSSPIIWGNRIFISSAIKEKEAISPVNDTIRLMNPSDTTKKLLQNRYRWELTCIDLKTGKEMWKRVTHKGNPGVKTHAGNTYASETPVTDGKRIYAYFGMTGLYCYDLKGNLLWQKDLGAFETQNGWGTGSSPVVYNDVLYVQVDNEVSSFLIALDTKTGGEIWKSARDEKTSYSTPVIWKNSFRVELVTTGKYARSYDPASGKLLWQLKLPGEYSIPSPVPNGDHIYLLNGSGEKNPGTLFSVKAGVDGDLTPSEGSLNSNGVEWSIPNPGSGNYFISDGLIYIIDNQGDEIICYNSFDGKPVYRESLEKVAACWASPWAFMDRIYFTDEKGVTHIIKAGEKFEILPENKIDDKFWASAAITSDAYILKGAKKLYCIKNLK